MATRYPLSIGRRRADAAGQDDVWPERLSLREAVLKAPAVVARLEALGEQLDGGDIAVRRRRADERPLTGTKLVREYQGATYTVTVRQHDFEWQGRPYTSLSAIARAITGTRWNGLVFFGLKNRRAGK
jgi:DUF2924 family protein